MTFEECEIAGAWIVDIEPREDERGFLARGWCADEFAAHGITASLAQINICSSVRRGTLRGLHYQLSPRDECKVARCTRGSVFDVVLDLRPGSPTRHRWLGVELTARNRRSLVIPEGCAHGFLTLEEDTELQYLTSVSYTPNAATGVRWNDPAFAIDWPMEPVVLSDRDRAWPLVERRRVHVAD